MKRFLFTTLIVTLLLTACGSTATPQPTVDIVATTKAMAGTMVAATLTAQPTATQQPSATPTETATPVPATETPTIAAGTTPVPPGETPAAGPTLTPEPFFGTLDPLGAGDYSKGFYRIDNNSGEPEIIVTIYGQTNQGNPKPVYMAYRVTNSFLFQIPWGDYNYTVQIGNKKTYTGSFIIRSKDKTTMRVYIQKVVVVGP